MSTDRTITRRSAVRQLACVGAGITLFGDMARLHAQEAARELIPFADIPPGFMTRRPGTFELPGQGTLGIDLRELTSWTTAPDDWFIVAHYNVPRVDASTWRLAVNGRAARPLTLTLDDIKRRRRVERTVAFECGGNRDTVMNRMVGNATWAGCSLKDLLEEARPEADVLEAIFWGADEGKETIRGTDYQMRFARSMSLTDAIGAGAILAYELEGAPLPIVHGFPVRLIVPGWYGVSNVKWLERIELTPHRFMGKFMGRDYVTIMGRQVGERVEYTETSVTRMLIKSMVARVTRSTGRSGGAISVFGVAYGDGTPIQRVDVRIDDGAWQPARLEGLRDPFAWVFWTLDVGTLPPGRHTIASRATDRRGRTQPADLALKKSNWENNAIWTRTIQV